MFLWLRIKPQCDAGRDMIEEVHTLKLLAIQLDRELTRYVHTDIVCAKLT